jgi:Xaa-Pro aminopeptidase
VGSYKLAGEHRALEAGFCLTVEPGIYIPADDEKADAAFRGIGVRIEDDVAITPEGHENLTSALPKAPREIEALVGSD